MPAEQAIEEEVSEYREQLYRLEADVERERREALTMFGTYPPIDSNYEPVDFWCCLFCDSHGCDPTCCLPSADSVFHVGDVEIANDIRVGPPAALTDRHSGGVRDSVHHLEIANRASRVNNRDRAELLEEGVSGFAGSGRFTEHRRGRQFEEHITARDLARNGWVCDRSQVDWAIAGDGALTEKPGVGEGSVEAFV